MRKIEYQEQIVASVFTFVFYNFVFVFNSYFIFSSSYRSKDYYSRLENRARSTAQLLLNVDEVSADLLRIIDKKIPFRFTMKTCEYTRKKSTMVYANIADSTVSAKLHPIPVIVQKRLEYHDGEREGLGLVV